jgi:hypothetical protein
MSDLTDVLADFVAEHRGGGPADPREFLRQVPAGDRWELAALIDAYLAHAPRQPLREPLEAGSPAQIIVDELARSLAGQGGLWPTLLPRLRDRAGIRRADLVRRLALSLGVGHKADKVAVYYHRMEQGLLPAAGVSDRVLEALGALLGEPAPALREAGQALAGPARTAPGSTPPATKPGARSAAGGTAAVFARRAFPEPPLMPSGPPPATPNDEPRDEVDRLFLGGG